MIMTFGESPPGHIYKTCKECEDYSYLGGGNAHCDYIKKYISTNKEGCNYWVPPMSRI